MLLDADRGLVMIEMAGSISVVVIVHDVFRNSVTIAHHLDRVRISV